MAIGWARALVVAGVALAALTWAGTGDPQRATGGDPFVRVLGTAQDGGFPHAACEHEACRRARAGELAPRLVASLGLVLPATHEVFLIDATPDIRPQLDALRDVRTLPPDRVDRHPVDGIFLTHAHIGHYLGLAFLGFEAVHTSDLPVWATPRMAAFLTANGPWSQLVSLGNIALRPLASGEPVELSAGVRVSAFQVPHRDEFSDTVAFVVRGPHRTVLYVPDTDKWSTWAPPLLERLAGIDVALLDGSFYSTDELPGRSVEQIGHPLMGSTMDLLQQRVDAGHLAVYFTHLNHSNPALLPDSDARREIERRGFAVAAEGQEIAL
jgi:pyrroloquinoline quinone biosynthesis protein B